MLFTGSVYLAHCMHMLHDTSTYVRIQWDPYNVNTLENKKHVLIIEVSSFEGEVYISRIGEINYWDI